MAGGDEGTWGAANVCPDFSPFVPFIGACAILEVGAEVPGAVYGVKGRQLAS